MEYWRSNIFWILALCLSGFARGEEVFFDADCLPTVVDFLSNTRSELRAVVFDINEPTIVEKLKELHWAGKEIHILSDRRQAGGKYSRVVDLYLLGLDVRLNSKKNLQHNKFAVRDGVSSVHGSFNWTNGASRRNTEDVTLTHKRWLPGGNANAMVNGFSDQFDTYWEQNLQEKSDGYFEKIIAKNRADILERWKPWILDTLKFESAWGSKGSARIASAATMIERLSFYSPRIVRALQGVARGGFSTSARTAAIRALSRSNTSSYSAHRTLVELARFGGSPEIRAAAQEGMDHLGRKLRIDPDTYWEGVLGGLRVFRTRCGQVFRFLNPW